MVISLTQNIFIQYLGWHFFNLPKKILKAWRNFLVFNLEYFSVGLLLRTLFSHWRRYQFFYPRGFDIGQYAQVFFSNLISRTLGAVLRAFLIILGLIVELLILILGTLFFLAWLFLPLILIIIFYTGFKLI